MSDPRVQVTITFNVRGEERHAAKLAEKVEAVVEASKRVVPDELGAVVAVVIEEAAR